MFKKMSLVSFMLVCFTGAVHADFPKFIDRQGDVRVSQLRPFMVALMLGKRNVKIKDAKYALEIYSRSRRNLAVMKQELKKLYLIYERKEEKDARKNYRKGESRRKNVNGFIRKLGARLEVSQIDEEGESVHYKFIFRKEKDFQPIKISFSLTERSSLRFPNFSNKEGKVNMKNASRLFHSLSLLTIPVSFRGKEFDWSIESDEFKKALLENYLRTYFGYFFKPSLVRKKIERFAVRHPIAKVSENSKSAKYVFFVSKDKKDFAVYFRLRLKE